MNEFNSLRTRAREKRDKAIAEIRRDYEATLVQIAAVEQDLLGRFSTRHLKISAAIDSLIPSDRPFNTTDIMAGLEALDPGRVWRKRSAETYVGRLRKRGLLKRLRRATSHEPALYVRTGVQAKVCPLDDMTLQEVIQTVLTRPMNTTEVLMAVVEAGYKSAMTKRALRNYVVRELRAKFKQEGGKWMAACDNY